MADTEKRKRFKAATPEAYIVRPDGRKLPVYFVCAGCGRTLIWTFEEGRCPKCYGDKFKIVGI